MGYVTPSEDNTLEKIDEWRGREEADTLAGLRDQSIVSYNL
jgi:hypothetical protein